MVKNRDVVEGLSAFITLDEIKTNSSILTPGAYLVQGIEDVVIADNVEALQKKNA